MQKTSKDNTHRLHGINEEVTQTDKRIIERIKEDVNLNEEDKQVKQPRRLSGRQ